MGAFNDDTKLQIEKAQTKAEEDVALVKKDMDALKDETKLQTKKIQQESQEEISKTYSETKRTTDEVLERSHEIERNAEQTAEQVLQRADSIVTDIRRNVQHKVDGIEENCMATVNEAVAEYVKMIG